MKKLKLAILGASGHGKVIADCAIASGWETIDFYDDAWNGDYKNGQWPVIGNTQLLIKNLKNYDGIIVGIGNNAIRSKKQVELIEQGAMMVNIIHPSAQISESVNLGLGCVVMPGAIVNIDSQIGDACIINTGATVDHDCILGNAIHVCPGVHLAGDVSIGDHSLIGIGAIIIQQISVGKNTLVGAGSVVINNIDSDCTVIGTPAKTHLC